MWFKIAKLCILFAILKTIEGKPNFALRSKIPSVGIFNGKEAAENQFPHQVVVISYFDSNGMNFQTFCGGSLISTTAVLTAAQCVKVTWTDKTFNAEKADIHLGSLSWPSKNVVTVSNRSSIKVYPEFNITEGMGDLALIILPSAVTPSKSVKPIALDFSSKDHDKEAAVVAGWGITKSDGSLQTKLRYVDLKVISNDECAELFSFVNETHICTAATNDKNEHVGFCAGDGGDALVSADGKQIGIASFMGRSCEDPTYPSGYTRVSEYEDWIKTNSNSTY